MKRWVIVILCWWSGLSMWGHSQECGLVVPGGGGDLSAPQLNAVWPNGVVPYEFQPGIAPGGEQDMLEAFAAVEAVCGVRFIPRTNEQAYLQVFQQPINTGFSQSELGFQNRAQWIRIRFGVAGRFGIVHEVLHTLGIWHEHQRPDRNAFVSVNTNNVQPGFASQFSIQNAISTTRPYDYFSLMHYATWTFGNCQTSNPTNCDGTNQVLTTTNPLMQGVIGQRNYLSLGDAQGLQDLYGPPLAPTISAIEPTWLPPFGAQAFITIDGLRFMRTTSNSANAAPRTRVRIDGVLVPVTIRSDGRLQAEVPANVLAQEGWHTLTVENPAPSGGGVSNSVSFLVGSTPGQRLGETMIAIEDLDHDAIPEVVVGMPGWLQDSGRVRCLSGADLQTVIWEFRGQTAGDRLGSSLALVGDFGANGSQDLAVGAPGRAGGDGGVALIRASSGSFVGWLGTPANGEAFGTAVAAAGDVNQDGRMDILVGAPLHLGGAGRVLIYSGAAGQLLRSMVGASAEQLGASLSGGLDATGDGRPDVLAGAPRAADLGPSTGAVYLLDPTLNHPFFGAVAARLVGSAGGQEFGRAVAWSDTPFGVHAFIGIPGASQVRVVRAADRSLVTTITGPAGFTEFGFTVQVAGDLDEDGALDIAASARNLGGPGALMLLSAADPTQRLRFDGVLADGAYGRAAIALPDRNGDLLFDLVISEPGFDGDVQDEGRLSVRTVNWPAAEARWILSEVIFEPSQAGVELLNAAPLPMDLQGYEVLWKRSDNGQIARSGLLPARLVPAGGRIALLRTGASLDPSFAVHQSLAVFPASIATTGPVTVALLDPAGRVTDEVRVDGTGAAHPGLGLGGRFLGAVPRSGDTMAVERFGALDSQTAADWTAERVASPSLENRSSGPRGTSPLPAPPEVLINEVVTEPDWIELRVGAQPVDLVGWSLRVSADEGASATRVFGWAQSAVVPAGAYVLVGTMGPLPVETPPGTRTVVTSTAGLSALDLGDTPFEVALYDARGRLVDLVRSTGREEQRIHNRPRAPGAWSDFVGGALRVGVRGPSIVARQVGSDSDSGSDWRTTTVRSLGLINPLGGFFGPIGHADRLSVRLDATPFGGGLTLIVNAGPESAGSIYRLLFSSGHLQGRGPIFGLGEDAVQNWLDYGLLIGEALDARGSARLDLAPLSLPPGGAIDALFFMVDPQGAILGRTLVLEYDTATPPI